MSETKNSMLSLRSVLLGVVIGVSSVALVNCKDGEVLASADDSSKHKPPVNWQVLQRDIKFKDPVSFALAVGTTKLDKPAAVVRGGKTLKSCVIGQNCDPLIEKRISISKPDSEITIKSYIFDEKKHNVSNMPSLFNEANADDHICVVAWGSVAIRVPPPCPVL